MSETDVLPVRVQNVLDMPVVRLNLWSIQFTVTNIKLEGFVRNEEGTMMQKVSSENICKRITATLLFDVSGRFFELVGQIDREFQLKRGMSGRVADEFQSGFPENWAFLIGSCLTEEQRSAMRPIQAPQPIRQKEREPIVTLADETEVKNAEKPEDVANTTLRAKATVYGDVQTPIRFSRGTRNHQATIFDGTPNRKTTVPLASSTPQPPPPKPRDFEFAVPNLPPPPPPPIATSSATSSDLDFFDEMSQLFDSAKIDKTPGRGETRKRHHRSPEEYRRRSRREEEEYEDVEDYRRRRENHDAKRYRHRESTSTSSSIRFDESHRHKLNEILRRERELERELEMSRMSRRRQRSSESEANDTMGDEWERENQEILDNSVNYGEMKKTTRPARKNVGKKTASFVAPKNPPKPKRAPKPPPPPATEDDLNDSIASRRPRRACSTPSTPAPKRVTWPKRDLDKLRRVIELKKPSASDEDWTEVARLLAKDGVDAADVRQIATTRLKWKEPEKDAEVIRRVEEEEKKRRNGVVAKVKEGMKMREELRTGGEKEADDLRSRVDSMEDYEPADVSADESLFAMRTPLVVKKKGGTRASPLPQPIEDSPMARGSRNASMADSPRVDASKLKEAETTMKYVQHLSTLQARPGSRLNRSRANASNSSKNTSMSVAQATKKAMKLVNKGRTIEEEDEEEEEQEEEEEENSIY